MSIPVQAGHTYQIVFGARNPNNRTVQVRSIVDTEYVVSRTWSQKRGYYLYAVDHMRYYEALSRCGELIHVGETAP